MDNVTTARTLLRPFTTADLDDLARIFAKPPVMKYLGPHGEPMSRDETREALKSMIRHWSRHGFGRWAVMERACGQMIGCAGLRSFEGIAELVYLLDEPAWGKGLATEVARACLRFGFETQAFPRVVAFARPGNLASRRVMEKIGMCFEGSGRIFGIEVVRYAITREQFAASAREWAHDDTAENAQRE